MVQTIGFVRRYALRLQFLAFVLVGSLLAWRAGAGVAVSFFYGAATAALPMFWANGAMRRWRRLTRSAFGLLAAFGLIEAGKLAVTVLLLFLAPRILGVPHWAALLTGLISASAVSLITLAAAEKD